MIKLKGFILIYTLTLAILIILIILTFVIIPYNSITLATATANSIKAYNIAEAGIAKKFMDLRSGSIFSLSEDFSLGTGDAGHYSVNVTNIAAGTFPTYRLDSTGTYRQSTRIISLTVRQISCARFSYFSHDEDQMFWWGERPIWFITGDTLRGPFHSNDQINISGSPIFEGPVSSSASTINYYNGGPPLDNPEFLESLSLGVPQIQLPMSGEIVGNVRTASQQAGGLYLTGNTAITLLSDGTMNVTNGANEWTNENMALPSNGAICVDNGYVDIAGTLNGQLTLATNGSIYITNNLLYHESPVTNPASTDMMGLVAQNNVYIDKNAPYNIEVDAYIVALNTSFGVENYTVSLKGTITLYGGITQYRRGPVGTFNGTTGERVSGYLKNYFYDTRLQSTVPLYFPPARDANGRVMYIKVSYSES